MAKFLNTSAVTYYLEEIIKNASERLILISPYLRLNDKIKELLEDKNRLKIDIRIIYGKTELRAEEESWLHELEFVRVSFCKNLHAKCYMNEQDCIITSLNLYEFSQVNNNEMGILLNKDEDQEVFKDAQDEANRIIRISDEVRAEKQPETTSKQAPKDKQEKQEKPDKEALEKGSEYEKLTTSKLAAKHKMKHKEFIELLVKNDLLTLKGKNHYLTQKGTDAGGAWLTNRFKQGFFVFPANLKLN